MFFIKLLVAFLILFILWRFLFFFRNPKRNIRFNENHILSPADGYVIYIKRIQTNEPIFSIKGNTTIHLKDLMFSEDINLFGKPGYLIGIYMSVIDVHYNRSPIQGYIKKIAHDFPTKRQQNITMLNALDNFIFNLKPFWNDCDYIIHNERASYLIKNDKLTIYVTQIADRWIKKIVTFKNEESIKQGEVFGLIRMGSQVDVFVPDSGHLKILIREGQHVKAGLTPLMEISKI